MGLNTTAREWPDFRWLSASVPPPVLATYEHWGRGDGFNEPNNLGGSEYCGAANATLIAQDVWGWSDWNCNMTLPYMCRLDGEPQAPWPVLLL